MKTIIEIAQNWLNQDPDDETRSELQRLIDEKHTDELEKRFSGRLQFGTAGLRGPIQAGPMGMNRVLVAQAAAGLAKFLLAREENPSIVIGYDARKNSKRFAQDTAEIMQGQGISAQIMPDLRPTPVLAFAVRHLKASAGVMVTASHNPPEDNGYKVYLGGDDDGAQIISPNDQLIAEQIQWVADNLQVNDLARSKDYSTIDQSVIDTYIDKTVEISKAPISDINYIYTAMHGVGTETLLTTLEKAGLPKPVLIAEQCEPDGTFPTVSFPNPEEAGALDLAIAKAKEINAEFIIANDPDSDRLAIAIADDAGEWKTLHGNEIGLSLAWYIAQKAKSNNETGILACSLVSSPALAKVAAETGLEHVETLTGFKYIGRLPNLIFGYEEALGYLVNPGCAHDKDGISAAVCFLDLINELKSEGKTFSQFRQEFAEKFGAFYSDQISIRVEDLGRIGRALSAIRNDPFTNISGFDVVEYIDHLETEKNNNILVFYVIDKANAKHRIIFRPSGTEPKLKVYIDTEGSTVTEAKSISDTIKQAINDFLNNIN